MEKPEKLEDQIHYDPFAKCEGCGKPGAFVYYTGDTFCFACMGIKVEIIIPGVNMETPKEEELKKVELTQADPTEVKPIEETPTKKPPHFVLEVQDAHMSTKDLFPKE